MTLSPRRFFNARPRIAQYMALELSHVAFGTKRYVADYFDKTLGGQLHQAAAIEVKETIQDDRAEISYEVQLGRVGSQAKQLIKAVDAYPLGWMIPIKGTVSYYLSNDLNTPYREPVTLDVSNIIMDGDAVALTLESSNPQGLQVARRYNGVDFPGTKAKV